MGKKIVKLFDTLANADEATRGKHWLIVSGVHEDKILKYKRINSFDGKPDQVVLEDIDGNEVIISDNPKMVPWVIYPKAPPKFAVEGEQVDHRMKIIECALKDIHLDTIVHAMHTNKQTLVRNPYEALDAMGYNMEYLTHFLEYKLSGEPLQLELGAKYIMQDGQAVTMVREVNKYEISGHSIMIGDNNLNYYNRQGDHGRDNGRVCTTEHDYSYKKNILRKNGTFVKYQQPARWIFEIKVKDDVMHGEGVIAYVIAFNKMAAAEIFLPYVNDMWVYSELNILDLGEADQSRPDESYITYFRGVEGIKDIGEDVKAEKE